MIRSYRDKDAQRLLGDLDLPGFRHYLEGTEMAIQKSKRLQPLHPGEVLKELLAEAGLTVNALAESASRKLEPARPSGARWVLVNAHH